MGRVLPPLYIIRMRHFYSKYCRLEAQRKSTEGVPLGVTRANQQSRVVERIVSAAVMAAVIRPAHHLESRREAVRGGTLLAFKLKIGSKGTHLKGTNPGDTS